MRNKARMDGDNPRRILKMALFEKEMCLLGFLVYLPPAPRVWDRRENYWGGFSLFFFLRTPA